MEAEPPSVALRSFLDFLRDVGGGGPAPVLVAHNAHKFDAVVLARNLMEHGLVEEASRCISVCAINNNISVYMGGNNTFGTFAFQGFQCTLDLASKASIILGYLYLYALALSKRQVLHPSFA